MNPYQLALQIRKELRIITWPSGAGDVVFGTHRGVVEVLAEAPTKDQYPPRFPCCFILLGDADADDDAPGLQEQSFQLIAGVAATGTPMGSHAITGGPSRNLGKSPGRGVAEVIERVHAAIGDLTGADGASLQVLASATAGPFTVDSRNHIAFAQLTVTAWCTRALHYAAPQQLTVSGSTWTWEGAHCSDRFDFFNYVLRSVASPNYPTGPTNGTAIYTGTAATTTHSPIGGQNYGIFAQYDARKDGTADGNSDAEVVGSTSDQ